MVEAGGLVEQPQQWRQVSRKAPVVLSTPEALHAGRGFVPPRRDCPRDRLDDEHTRSARGSVEQLHLDGAPALVRQLVQGVGRDDRARRGERGKPFQIANSRLTAQVQLPIRAPAFIHRPGMAIDAEDLGAGPRAQRPRGAANARTAAKIDDVGRSRTVAADSADDVRDRQQMQRAVEQRECRPLAGGRKRGAGGKSLAALYIGRRQCTQRTRDLGHPEVGEMAGFERRQPSGKPFVLR
jgi:hypothetical protein